MKKDKKKDKPVNKTPELSKAKKALDAYLKENNLRSKCISFAVFSVAFISLG